jgi:hypothetical protein
MAKVLNREFRIHWQKEDVSRYIDYEKYKITNVSDAREVFCQDQHAIKHDLMQSHTCLNSSSVRVFLNQEIAQYLYANPQYRADHNYFDDIFAAYKNLYTDILKPTPYVMDIVEGLCSSTEQPLIGIQIRTGDVYMQNNASYGTYTVFNDPATQITSYLKKIKNHIESRRCSDYRVFITSDFDKICDIAAGLWDNVVYYHEPVQHIDRPVSGEFGKFYIDNYILSQRTTEMYISTYSNYGRVAALSAPHCAVWDLDGNPVILKQMVSKHDIIFPTI